MFLISMIGMKANVIPGYNFKNLSDGDTSAPDSWQCHNNKENGFHAVSKSIDHYAGAFSVKLAIQMNAGIDTIVGIVDSKQEGG